MTDTRRQEIERLVDEMLKVANDYAFCDAYDKDMGDSKDALMAAIDALLKDAEQLRKCIAEARSRLRPVDCMPCELASYKLDAAIAAAIAASEGEGT
jgi:hypothetical protein